jgi:hypothetical protein
MYFIYSLRALSCIIPFTRYLYYLSSCVFHVSYKSQFIIPVCNATSLADKYSNKQQRHFCTFKCESARWIFTYFTVSIFVSQWQYADLNVRELLTCTMINSPLPCLQSHTKVLQTIPRRVAFKKWTTARLVHNSPAFVEIYSSVNFITLTHWTLSEPDNSIKME